MTDNMNETEMAEKLVAAGEKVAAEKAERRQREVKGAHLLPKLMQLATEAGLQVEEMSGFTKLTGPDKSKRVLLAKKGGRVDLSGFSLELSAVKQISETEAREKHMGKVRGQLDFEKTDDEVVEAYSAALTELKNSTPKVEKPKRAPKPAATESETTEPAPETSAG